MAGTISTLDGVTKRVFGKMVAALPEFAYAQEALPFQDKAKIGAEYEELIVVRRSHGVTHQKTSRQTLYALNAARTMQTAPARTSGAEIVMRDQVSYGTLAATDGGSEKAYEAALPLIIGSLLESHRFYLELGILYGNSPTGMGVWESTGAGTTTRVIVLTSQSWATGIWSQMEGAGVDAYDVTGATKLNTTAVIDVGAVDPTTRSITLTGAAADLTALTTGAFFVPVGARTSGVGQQMDGIDMQMSNTGSLYGINPATYGIWKGNTLAVGSVPATIFTIGRALKLPVGRGLIGKSVKAFINEAVFNDIADDAAGLRRFGENQKMGVEQGTNKLTFNGANNNSLEIVSHPMVKQGDGFIFNPKDWIRGGESDIRNGFPGEGAGDKFWFDLEGFAGKELRQFSSQFVLDTKPSQQVKLSGISARSAV